MEDKIMGMMQSEYSWEQIIYNVVAQEGIDPWNVDIKVLSTAFVDYLQKLEEMDFKIPAKYVIIAAVLLRMKSDQLKYLGDIVHDAFSFDGMDVVPNGEAEGEEAEGEVQASVQLQPGTLEELGMIDVPAIRQPRRKIVIDDLISALRRALKTEDRKEVRERRGVDAIQLREDNITGRLMTIYNRIYEIMGKLHQDEVKFSGLVQHWEKDEIVDTFLPLLFLDNQKKVNCHQEEMFKEIYIKKGEETLTEDDVKELEGAIKGKPVKAHTHPGTHGKKKADASKEEANPEVGPIKAVKKPGPKTPKEPEIEIETTKIAKVPKPAVGRVAGPAKDLKVGSKPAPNKTKDVAKLKEAAAKVGKVSQKAKRK